MMRLNGEIAEIPGTALLAAEESKRLIYSILYEEQRAKFEENWELDCSFAVTGFARFRVNVLVQKNGVEAVMRVIATKIPTPEQLRLSPAVIGFSDLPRGLVLSPAPRARASPQPWPPSWSLSTRSLPEHPHHENLHRVRL